MDISHSSGCEHRAQEESGQFSTVGCTGQNSFREQIVLPVLLNIRTTVFLFYEYTFQLLRQTVAFRAMLFLL